MGETDGWISLGLVFNVLELQESVEIWTPQLFVSEHLLNLNLDINQ